MMFFGALHPGDLVLPEEIIDTLGALGHRLGLVLVGGFEVELDVPAQHTEPGTVPGLLEQVGSMKERFGGDATTVEAGPAEEGVFLDNANVEAELPRPDPSHVPARSGPDDHDVVLRFGHRAPSLTTAWRGDSF
jgi:hypothetical protein